MSSFIDFESNGLEEDNLKMMGPQSTSSTANGLDKAAMEEVCSVNVHSGESRS
jgi:hypothetical protein